MSEENTNSSNAAETRVTFNFVEINLKLLYLLYIVGHRINR